MATTEQLLSKVGERLGLLQVSHDWLELQLSETQTALVQTTTDRDEVQAKHDALSQERNALAARVRELELPPMTGPTPRNKKRLGRVGLK